MAVALRRKTTTTTCSQYHHQWRHCRHLRDMLYRQLTIYMTFVVIWTTEQMALNQAFNVIVTHLCDRLRIIESHHRPTNSQPCSVTAKGQLLVWAIIALCNSSISPLARIRIHSRESLLIEAHRTGKTLIRSNWSSMRTAGRSLGYSKTYEKTFT